MKTFKLAIPYSITLAVVLLGKVALATPFVPGGLTAGDKYHLVFVSFGQQNAVSGLIGSYNGFIQTQAALNPVVTGTNIGVQYSVIGSTTGMSALANAPITAPVYNFFGVGQKVADNSADMWDGTLDTPILYDQFGNTGFVDVWTGTDSSGAGVLGNELGAANPETGLANLSSVDWIDNSTTSPQAGTFSFYGLSQELTVPNNSVPEPSALAILAMLSAIAWTARRKRLWGAMFHL